MEKTTNESNLAQSNPLVGLTEGDLVHFVMPDGEHRPAIVVKVWRVRTVTDNGETLKAPDNGVCQVQVFTDGYNDVDQWISDGTASHKVILEAARSGIMWKTSVLYSLEPKPNTWHWVERP